MDIVKECGFQPAEPTQEFQFQCFECGDCCRKVRDTVMVENFDLFRIAKSLNLSIEATIEKYMEPIFLAPGFPILTLKTTTHMDSCIFLKSGKCSIHSVRPRTCRLFPIGIGPDDTIEGKFVYFIVSKDRLHFIIQNSRAPSHVGQKSLFGLSGRDLVGRRSSILYSREFPKQGKKYSVKDWVDMNLSEEDRFLVHMECKAATELGRIIRKIDPSHEQEVATRVLYFKYINFDVEQEFKGQYMRNLECLKDSLNELASKNRR